MGLKIYGKRQTAYGLKWIQHKLGLVEMIDIISFRIIKNSKASNEYSVKDILCYFEGAMDYKFTNHQKIKLANELADMPSIFQMTIRLNDELYRVEINQDEQNFSKKFLCNLN